VVYRRGMQTCGKCGETLPLHRFRVEPSTGRRRKTCRRCRGRQSAHWRKRTGYKAPGAAISTRKTKLKALYGLTVGEADALIAAGCAVCGATVSVNGKRLSIDHCHTTGRVRGVLCHGCNLALGAMRESPELIRRLAAYAEVVCQGAK
jgi:hypothetical protein